MPHSMSKLKLFGLIVTLALTMSLLPLGIDSLLPAFRYIQVEYGLVSSNSVQLVVTSFFLGITIGTLIYGFLSDMYGRKKILILGLTLYLVAAFLSLFSNDFESFVIWRFIQGFGVASARVVIFAIVRDKFSGKAMAQVMSIMIMVFMTVPIIAPLLGSYIIMLYSWYYILGFIVIITIAVIICAILFLTESLPRDKRLKFEFKVFKTSFKEVITNKVTLIYTLITGLVFGIFLGYLNSIEQIIRQIYDQEQYFNHIFALGAGSFLISNFINIFLMRIKVLKLHVLSIYTASIATVPYGLLMLVTFIYNGVPPLFLFVSLICLGTVTLGIIIACGNTMTIAPMGHIAGTASTFIAFVSSLVSLILGAVVGAFLNDTIYALAIANFIFAVVIIVLSMIGAKAINNSKDVTSQAVK